MFEFTAIDAIEQADVELGVGEAHIRAELVTRATEIYVEKNPTAKNPKGTISSAVSHAINRDTWAHIWGLAEDVGDGKIIIHPINLKTLPVKEQEEIEEEIQNFALEEDLYPIIEKLGYTIIAAERGNGRFMNPDAYKIVAGDIESVEVKNHISQRDVAIFVGEAVINGAWANQTRLVYVDGPDEDIATIARAVGVGVSKLRGETLTEIVPSVRKEISKDAAKLYVGNVGIARAFVER